MCVSTAMCEPVWIFLYSIVYMASRCCTLPFVSTTMCARGLLCSHLVLYWMMCWFDFVWLMVHINCFSQSLLFWRKHLTCQELANLPTWCPGWCGSGWYTIGGRLLLVRGVKRRSWPVPGHPPPPPRRGFHRPRALLPHSTHLRPWLRLCSRLGHLLAVWFGVGPGARPRGGWGELAWSRGSAGVAVGERPGHYK
jgi:hypothetical protein